MTAERLDPNLRRQLLAEDTQFVGRPFALGPDMARSIQAHTRHMALMLLDSTLLQRGSRAAAYAENLIDMTSAAHVTERVDCAKGCAHCCTAYVSTTLPEVFHLAQAVRNDLAATTRVKNTAATYRASGVSDLPCPILDNNICAAYANRPGVCRTVMSVSVAACERIILRGSNEPFATPPKLDDVRAYSFIMLRAALALAGLPSSNYELSQALEVALTQDDAETRWLAGEPLFAAVPVGRMDRTRWRMHDLIDALADAVRPTI
jgi:Fe-S-cluster containining protein